MEKSKDNPGVYLPPPVLYASTFLISRFMQKHFPIGEKFRPVTLTAIIGGVILTCGLLFVLPALYKFFKTKNTLITIKPARSLQTTGIYSFSRNPMYMGLLCFYTGLIFFVGNWYTVMFWPLLILLVNNLVIYKEERYLERAFGEDFINYKRTVRRWI